ncbi:aminoacyl-tRNA hydrolase [Candidatus Dependentiae bacterium]|nr:aminoacyl-tRNA hydrolase [Candidatus Dependentiae bacterium]
MEKDLIVQQDIIIPHHELLITASKSGGPGGQHVNKTSSKITVRWNILHTTVLSAEQKARIMQNLQGRLTTESELVVHASDSRSQQQNKELAMKRLADEVRKALYIPKKRLKKKQSQASKEARLRAKSYRSNIKKLRSKKMQE